MPSEVSIMAAGPSSESVALPPAAQFNLNSARPSNRCSDSPLVSPLPISREPTELPSHKQAVLRIRRAS